jgi:hypothetical protein
MADLALTINAVNNVTPTLKAVTKDVHALGNAAAAQNSKFGALGKSMSSFGQISRTAFLGVGAGAAVGVAALVNFTKAAAEEQVGIERLKTSIKTLSADQQAAAASVEDLVRAREKLAFADDEIRDSLAQLIPATGDFSEAVKRQKIAMDLARGTGLDLATASRLVSKVTEDNVQVLRRYGITLRDGISEQEALAEIQAKFAGQSEAFAQTAAGKWALFGNQMQNIKETIGAALLPVVTQLAGALSDFLIKHQPAIDRFSQALAEKIPKAIDAIKQAFDDAKPTLDTVFDNIKSGFETIKPALEWVLTNKPVIIAAIAAIGAAALLAFTPISLPVLGVVAALGAMLAIVGVVKDNWEEWRGRNDLLAASIKTTESQLVALKAAMDAISPPTIALIGHIRNSEAAMYALQAAAVGVWVIMQPLTAVFVALKAFVPSLVPAINRISQAFRDLAGAVDKAADAIRKLPDMPKLPLLPSLPVPNILKRASGGPASGWTLVGERGPELLRLPSGSRVFNNAESREMTAQQGGNVFHVYIQHWENHGDPRETLAALGMGL